MVWKYKNLTLPRIKWSFKSQMRTGLPARIFGPTTEVTYL